MSNTEKQNQNFTPECRYGHGNLCEVTGRGKYPNFAILALNENMQTVMGSENGNFPIFIGRLYVCKECGYTEFFDDEPHLTFLQESAE
jgi:predicted nucleic-acid-binding Zn-ribbon protein